MESLIDCFRPLSRGLFFNDAMRKQLDAIMAVFVPFLGDFFSMIPKRSFGLTQMTRVFVPFLGDFFSITKEIQMSLKPK